ncbi:hypothetical protein ERO13_D11G226340v2 [Gossypium hirsutum]|uniref:Uncharacterized protein n=1 Tax=Gossypium tomentosum TaxID=34277 RepID=A0A5D2ISH7_GOSTO|nr:hypothetical protein ERO13_D11G226340v2 [Gossypium hirsutum]TYH45300.1 hypothetical protein ES332_D11G254900v1 [Gossypium tomentosum]
MATIRRRRYGGCTSRGRGATRGGVVRLLRRWELFGALGFLMPQV